MSPAKSIKERLEQYIIQHPSDSFNLESLLAVVGKEHKPQTEKALKEFQKREGIFKPLLLKDSFHPGFFRKNPDYKTLEEIRSEAEAAGKERVTQNGKEWKPTEHAITPGEHSSWIHRRRHFRSILDRMMKSDAFSPADAEFLRAEAPHLTEPLKEAQVNQGAR